MTDANSNHTAAYKLFKYPFMCRVAAIHTRTEAEIEQRGTYMSGDREKDRALAYEMVDIQTTIRQMVEYHKEGAEVVLINPEDSVRIYEIISEFMNGYDEALNFRHNIAVESKEFFIDLDSFATQVYKVARIYIPKNIPKGGLFDSISRLNKRSMIKRNNNNEPVIKIEKEHKPISESISLKALERDRRWKS